MHLCALYDCILSFRLTFWTVAKALSYNGVNGQDTFYR